MAPLGTLEHDEAVAGFAEQAASLAAGGVDCFWIETMSDLAEITAAIEGVRAADPDAAHHRDHDLRHPWTHHDGRLSRSARLRLWPSSASRHSAATAATGRTS